MPYLPKLIFTDTHNDPIIGEILNKIFPKLIDLGYECFLSETPENKTNLDQINFTKLHISLFSTLENEKGNNDLHNAYLKLLPFYENMYSLDFPFKGIDFNCLDDPGMRHWAISEKGIEQRDKKFAQSYLNEERDVFGMVGFRHALGMQKIITNSLSHENANNFFHFVHIFKQPPINDYEIDLRENRISYPIGVQKFDANEMSGDDIINHLLHTLSLKQEAINEYFGREKVEIKPEYARLKLFNTELLRQIKVDPEKQHYMNESINFLKKNQILDEKNRLELAKNSKDIKNIYFILYDLNHKSCLNDITFNMVINAVNYLDNINDICDILDHQNIEKNEVIYLLLLEHANQLDEIYFKLKSADRKTIIEIISNITNLNHKTDLK